MDNVDDLEELLKTLPLDIVGPLRRREDLTELLEIVLDLGRPPEARFPGHEVLLSDREVTNEDLQYVVSRIGAFGDDNRAGIERTLHRISAIRNRLGRIVGLTLRVGRAIYGTMAIIQDIVESGKSILLLGRPGVGKTTMLREVARVLADDLRKRVIVVDSSNEIAGDGDIPHPAIGRARRMQVATPALQHAVMIEAVENHMPEVIVIDEIGTEMDAGAARTIAERGVQLVATAHGNTLDNLMMNPTLADLIGGIQTVTLGDEEARRRGTQKSVLERKAPPTFDVLVEIKSWDQVAVHDNVAEVVDSILRGQPLTAEVRSLQEGQVSVLQKKERARPADPQRSSLRLVPSQPKPTRLLPFGIGRERLEQAVRLTQAPVQLVRDLRLADMVMTCKSYYRKKPPLLKEAEETGVPVYVLRSNTLGQMQQGLISLYQIEGSISPTDEALREAENAVNQVIRLGEPVELAPQSAYIRRLQHQLAGRHNLSSVSSGKEPYRRVRIYKDERQ
ncbi:MAG: R3H domain-containing nucleic acid-binding protein [Dehalococcoidia bacterium]|nr:R3H domain-containing nucleic acid-binding protein [Dehalococcoidia bacterium]